MRRNRRRLRRGLNRLSLYRVSRSQSAQLYQVSNWDFEQKREFCYATEEDGKEQESEEFPRWNDYECQEYGRSPDAGWVALVSGVQ